MTEMFYLCRHTICLFESPEVDPDKTILCHYLLKIKEDKHGRLHLLNPLTSSKRRTPMALDIRNFRIFKLGDKIFSAHACMEITMKAVFPCLSSKCEDFLLASLARGKMIVYTSGNEQWNMIEEQPVWYDDAVLFKNKIYLKHKNNCCCRFKRSLWKQVWTWSCIVRFPARGTSWSNGVASCSWFPCLCWFVACSL